MSVGSTVKGEPPAMLLKFKGIQPWPSMRVRFAAVTQR